MLMMIMREESVEHRNYVFREEKTFNLSPFELLRLKKNISNFFLSSFTASSKKKSPQMYSSDFA
jgi:hypothetical protein